MYDSKLTRRKLMCASFKLLFKDCNGAFVLWEVVLEVGEEVVVVCDDGR